MRNNMDEKRFTFKFSRREMETIVDALSIWFDRGCSPLTSNSKQLTANETRTFGRALYEWLITHPRKETQ
jgi:hypothetical protein